MKKLSVTFWICALATASMYADQAESSTVTIDGMVYTINNGEASLTVGNLDATGDFVIPSEVEYEGVTYPVTSVGDDIFNFWSHWGNGTKVGITSLTIPSSVKSIGIRAFGHCLMTELEIPETVKSIGEGAFSDCDSLKSVVVNGGKEFLGNNVFGACKALERAVISEGHSVVSPGMFHQCISLIDVELPSTLIEIGGGGFLSGAFSYCTSLASIDIPAGVKNIGSEVFSSSGLVEVILPEGLETLGNYVFSQCEQLLRVNIPNSISFLSEGLFHSCYSLESINLPENIKEIPGNDWMTGCFVSCKALKDVNLGSVETIGGYAFYDCESLKEITIPSSVTVIGNNVFERCVSLESINIGASLESIGEFCFKGVESLMTITVDPANINFEVADGILYNAGKTEVLVAPKNISGIVTLPETVTKLRDHAFADCKTLSGLTLNQGLESIDEYVITGCENLHELMIPSSVSEIALPYAFFGNSLNSFEVKHGNTLYSSCGGGLYDKEGIELLRWVLESQESVLVPDETLTIGEKAFMECKKISRVTLPPSVSIIKSDAFISSSLKDIELPELLTEIGERAFCGCGSLSKVIIPDGVTIIGPEAFARCDSLSKLVLPANLQEIPDDLCLYGNSLSEIEIPKFVRKIGRNAFLWCPIQEVIIPENVELIGQGAFHCSSFLTKVTALPVVPPTIESYSLGFHVNKVYVKSEALDAYQTAQYWSQFNLSPIDDLNGLKDIEADDHNVDFWIIYSIDGNKVLETGDCTRVQNLKPGLYIINGKKHVIR